MASYFERFVKSCAVKRLVATLVDSRLIILQNLEEFCRKMDFLQGPCLELIICQGISRNGLSCGKKGI